MFGNNSSAEADLDSLLGDFPVDESSRTFLDLFRLNLVGIERIVFIFLCSCIIIIGLSANCCIILANVLHRLRYSRENDFYTGRARSLSRISIVGANPFKVNLTPENRLSYFSALSGQAKFRQLFQTLYEIGAGKKNIELEKSITQIQLVLTLPLAVFILTWIATIIMYAVIVKHIHVATVTVSRISIQPDDHRSSLGSGQSPHPSLWQSVVRKNFHKCLILGAGTLTFYILETPTFLVVYNISPPSSWMLAAHFLVHVITPLLHIMLSKSFRAALGRMLRPRRAGNSIAF
ncbi:conserved hypothetical protein [Echinococcus multilocularis]|uniref:G protein-coupled receptor n=1 Tax=Echinococcus multilocularis TaxID=6211 RepID=A0A068YID1_ECHMU|nr:conserved hypothetical protein [Echinococcus multilocularis]